MEPLVLEPLLAWSHYWRGSTALLQDSTQPGENISLWDSCPASRLSAAGGTLCSHLRYPAAALVLAWLAGRWGNSLSGQAWAIVGPSAGLGLAWNRANGPWSPLPASSLDALQAPFSAARVGPGWPQRGSSQRAVKLRARVGLKTRSILPAEWMQSGSRERWV